jgi:hypothetical protein
MIVGDGCSTTGAGALPQRFPQPLPWMSKIDSLLSGPA